MKDYIKWFNNYFKNFEIKNKNILRKFHHTYRVMEYSKDIGKSINLNEHDLWLCEIIGIFHDLGRFKQWTEYHTYNDIESIDHAALAVDILKEENVLDSIDEKDKNIIYNAINYHNKYIITNDLDDETIKFCKIIRDADKLDIMLEQLIVIEEVEDNLSPELLDSLYQKKSCDNKDVKTNIDIILRLIGFIFDLNFKYSYNFIVDKKIIDNKFNLLKNYVNNIEEVEKLEKFINLYIEEMTKC